MNKKRILSIMIISVMAMLLLTACGASNTQGVSNTPMVTGDAITVLDSELRQVTGSMMYLTFEDAAQMATDVVVAEFVEKRPFGRHATEFEFIVHERIFGNAADTIFVYTMNALRLSVAETGHSYMDDERQFTTGTQYLLLLEKIADLYTSFHDDGFVFLTDIMLDINNPSTGTMYNEPLSQHSTGLNFNSRNLSYATIISYVSTLTQNNTPARDFIKSDKLEDIIEGSPYVLIVDITTPRRMASEGVRSDLRSTDIYYTTVVEVLKGDMQVGDLVRMIFFADTVFLGERHIVSITPRNPDTLYFYGFTSRNSLHRMDQLNEIREILGKPPVEQVAHPIILSNGGTGASVTLATAVVGQAITINAGAAPANQVFAGWTSPQGVTFADVTASVTTFIMPDLPVTVTANWQAEAPPPRLLLNVDNYIWSCPNCEELTLLMNSGGEFENGFSGFIEWTVYPSSVIVTGNATFTAISSDGGGVQVSQDGFLYQPALTWGAWDTTPIVVTVPTNQGNLTASFGVCFYFGGWRTLEEPEQMAE